MSEPFPLLNTSADQLHNSDLNGGAAIRRRKSSAIGGDIRAGDTGAPAFASSRASLNASEQHHSTNGVNATKDGGKRKGRKRGMLTRARQTMVKHTWVLPAIILVILLAAYAVNPTKSNPLHYGIFLAYEMPDVLDDNGRVQYGKGKLDFAFVAFYTIVLSFTREFVMQEILRPLARRAGLSKGKQARFMEQVYTALYFSFLGPWGLYAMSRTPVWYFNTYGMYEGFPHKTHDACFKFYYLFQAAYWAQQAIVLVLGMEKPRKDFKELVGHHVVTLALIGLSYRFHFTYMGIAVYITHDVSDWFLATVKTLNYLDSPILAPFYAVFMCAWIYLRHYVNLRIIWSLFNEFQTVGPYVVDWEAQQYKCPLALYITAPLLISLQALNLFWLFYIVRIAYRMLAHNVAEDDRSEDEDEDEAEDKVEEKLDNGKANGYSSAVKTNGTATRR